MQIRVLLLFLRGVDLPHMGVWKYWKLPVTRFQIDTLITADE